jgi:hypothetical protein
MVCEWDFRRERVRVFELRLRAEPVLRTDNREIVAARFRKRSWPQTACRPSSARTWANGIRTVSARQPGPGPDAVATARAAVPGVAATRRQRHDWEREGERGPSPDELPRANPHETRPGTRGRGAS